MNNPKLYYVASAVFLCIAVIGGLRDAKYAAMLALAVVFFIIARKETTKK